MENVEWVNKHTIIVNGWLFDFEKMRARRVFQNVGRNYGRDKGHLHWDEERKCVSISTYPDSEKGHTMTGLSDGKFYSIFVPPEDNFNAMVNNAYVLYCLEKELTNV